MLNLNSHEQGDPDTNLRRHPGRSSEPGSIEAVASHGTKDGTDRGRYFGLRKQIGTMDPGLHGNRGDGSIRFRPPPLYSLTKLLILN